jgi:outer membrane murein-binding lipoprotein Lpp
MDDRLVTLEQKVSQLSSAVTALEQRLAQLETCPVASAAAAEASPVPDTHLEHFQK